MSRSPDSEITATSNSPPSVSSCSREKTSPTMFISRNKSPVSDVILKGSPSAFPSYPIVIPTIRRVPPSPDCRRSRSPLHSCIPVITTGRRGSASAGMPSSSSPRRDGSPPTPERLMRCSSPSEDILETHHPVHLTDAKSCGETSPTTTRRLCATDGCSTASAPSSAPDSRQLKFGMERILSEEISPVVQRHQHQGW